MNRLKGINKSTNKAIPCFFLTVSGMAAITLSSYIFPYTGW